MHFEGYAIMNIMKEQYISRIHTIITFIHHTYTGLPTNDGTGKAPKALKMIWILIFGFCIKLSILMVWKMVNKPVLV